MAAGICCSSAAVILTIPFPAFFLANKKIYYDGSMKNKNKKLLHPLDETNKEDLVKKMEVGKQPFYSVDLTRDHEPDVEQETATPTTDLAGPVNLNEEIDQSTVSSFAGEPGGAGVDEDAA